MSHIRRVTGHALVYASILTLIFTAWSYTKQPDSLAFITVFPTWFWGAFGILLSVFAFYLLRTALPIVSSAIWILTLPYIMDEAQVLSNFAHPRIATNRVTPLFEKHSIRIATVNCADLIYGNPIEDIKAWDPDIVLIQQAKPHQVAAMASYLYGKSNNFRANTTNGIITRHEIIRAGHSSGTRNQQLTIRLPNEAEIEVVNIHLAVAATDLRFWKSDSRNDHKKNRQLRRIELSAILETLEQNFPDTSTPIIIGGDFNASATDITHRQLNPKFIDSFSSVGRGWGNTFHRRFPILRIDHIYATKQLEPVSSGVIVSKKTDHRIVITDYLINNPVKD